MTSSRLLLVGNPLDFHVGGHFFRAANNLGYGVEIADVRAASAAPWPLVQFNWRLRGHRPARLEHFSHKVVDHCQHLRPTWLLATGLAPVDAPSLHRIKSLGIQCALFLTDDPWNPSHSAKWFFSALPLYDWVFSPRQANIPDLLRHGCPQVHYLPFAYAPDIHYIEATAAETKQSQFASDVLFFGGADRDRLPLIQALLATDLRVALHGGYWERYPVTRPHARGQASPATLRQAVASATVTLCLVRRANRDGHVMRSYEAPAMGACMVVEDTAEHRALYGQEGQHVLYFSTKDEMLKKIAWLLENPLECMRLRTACHQHITSQPNTYADRLHTIHQTIHRAP